MASSYNETIKELRSIRSSGQIHSPLPFFTMSSPVLIVGATRGLGSELTRQYAGLGRTVYGTSRNEAPSTCFPPNINWLSGVDLMKPTVGETIVDTLHGAEALESVVSLSLYPELHISRPWLTQPDHHRRLLPGRKLHNR